MLQYKTNLSIINGRYGDLERKVLTYFADHPEIGEIRLSLSGNMDIQILNLLKDGHLTFDRQMKQSFSVGIEPDKIYKLTEVGRQFIRKWLCASELD
jgi:hypothetical protein